MTQTDEVDNTGAEIVIAILCVFILAFGTFALYMHSVRINMMQCEKGGMTYYRGACWNRDIVLSVEDVENNK